MDGMKMTESVAKRSAVDEREQLTREAMAEVDAGKLIDHATVQSWADSLGTEDEIPVPRAG